MLQNVEVSQPVQKISRIETILMPPVVDKAGNPTGGKFRVDGMVGGKHYEITPTRNWNEMTVFDNAHQIETSKGKMALSDFLLKNVRGLTQLAIDQGFVKPEDTDVGIPLIGADNKPMENAVEYPLKFLKGKNGELTVPKNLSLEQTQNLMLLIFEKTKNTPDFAERDNKKGLTKILLEQIRNNYNKLGEAGKVPDDPQNPSGIFTEEPVFEALNIACRKAVEARTEEQAYRKTKTYERKGESRSQRLLNRLSIAAGIVDESTGGTARKQIKELQEIHQRDANGEKTSSLEFSVQMDLFMAQAFDILVPAEARVQMKKAQMEIDNTSDYKKRADLIQVANKEKQMWRMAILNHFQVERTLPSKTKIPSIADEIRNPKIFSWEERMKIENDYTNSIANEISALEKSRKDQGGLAELDLSSVNLIKTEQLLEQILPKTGRPEQRAKRVEDALKELFAKTSEMIKEEDGKPPKKNTDKWDKYIKDTGLLTGLQGEQRELAKRAIEDALATQLSMEFKLQISSEKIGAPTKPTDVKFGSEINRGLKGVELLYRRGVSQEIPKGKRYESLDSKGKPNYKMVMDDYGVYHIQSTKEAIPNEDYRAIEAAMSQTSVPKNAETDQVPEEQKIKDEQAVELAKLLGFKEPITNEAEFRDNMLGSEIFVLVDNQEGEGQHYEMNIEMLNLTSVDQLNTLSHLSEFYTNMPILVESLNLTINEAGGPEAISTIQNFNIESLILSGPTSGERSETNIALLGGSCDYIEIRQGQFNISTDRAPIRVAMIEGQEAKASQMILTEGALSEITSRNEDLRTEFMMGNSSFIQILVKNEGEPTENKIVYEDPVSHNVSKGNTGKFILINEDGVYKLVDSEYKFPEQSESLEDFANIIGKPPPPNPEPTEGPTIPPKPEKFKHKQPEEIAAMDPASRVEYLQAELGATLGSRQRLALVRRIINECSENDVNVDGLIPKLGALSGVTGADLATSPILAELMDDVSKLTITENTPPPKPEIKDTRTPLERFKDDHKLKPQPTPEPAVSTVEMNLPMDNLEVGQVYILPDGREARYGGHVLGNFLDPDVKEHHYFLPVDGGETVNLTPDAMVGSGPQLEEQSAETGNSQEEIRKATADLLKEQPLETPQAEVLEEVHDDVPAEASSRPGIRNLWANRPWWLGGGKKDESLPTEPGLTRAEIVRRRRQPQGNSSPTINPVASAQSATPVDTSQTDNTVMFDEAPVNIPAEEKVEQVGAQATEATVTIPVRDQETDEALRWLESLTAKKGGEQPTVVKKVEKVPIDERPPQEQFEDNKDKLLHPEAKLSLFDKRNLVQEAFRQYQAAGGELTQGTLLNLSFIRSASVAQLAESPDLNSLIEELRTLNAPGAKVEDDDIPDWLKTSSSGKKIASADDESSSGGGAADNESELPDWLKNRR